MSRDCKHGQLARSCDRCADAEEIAELRAALKAIYQRAIDAHPTIWERSLAQIEVLARSAIDGTMFSETNASPLPTTPQSQQGQP